MRCPKCKHDCNDPADISCIEQLGMCSLCYEEKLNQEEESRINEYKEGE